MSHITERSDKSRAATIFAKIIARDAQQRPTVVIVPGSEMKSYRVIIRRNGHITTECLLETAHGQLTCQGNRKVVCYHCMAALIIASEQAGKRVSFCDDAACAERLTRTGGKSYEVRSTSSDARPIWMVVKEPAPSITDTAHDEAHTVPLALLDSKYLPQDWERATQMADEMSAGDHEAWAERRNEYILDGSDDRPTHPAPRVPADYIDAAYNERKAKLALLFQTDID